MQRSGDSCTGLLVPSPPSDGATWAFFCLIYMSRPSGCGYAEGFGRSTGRGGNGLRLTQLARQAPWAVVALVLLAIVLAVLPFVLLPESVSGVGATLTSVGSIVLLVFALFSLVRDTFSAWQMVAVLAIVLGVVAAALLTWRLVDHFRPLTVTDSVTLEGAKAMKNRSTATVVVKAPAPREQLLITFEATDRALGSPCAPTSSLRITGGAEGSRETRFGRKTVVRLDADDPSIRLKAQLLTDSDCELDLRVQEAVLDND
jgi:hypothetical protein